MYSIGIVKGILENNVVYLGKLIAILDRGQQAEDDVILTIVEVSSGLQASFLVRQIKKKKTLYIFSVVELYLLKINKLTLY